MGKPSKAVLEFMETHSIDSDEVWQVPDGAWVVKHKALERAASAAGIAFDAPQIATRDFVNEGVALLVIGKLGDKTEWSFGEASNFNLTRKSEKRPLYPWAMAEKRAKDRVILKLLNQSGALYSEAESEEFSRPNPHVTRAEDILPSTEYDQNGQPIDNIPEPDAEAIVKTRVVDQRPIFTELQNEIHATGSIDELSKWADENRNRLGKLSTEWRKMLRGVYAEHQTAIRNMDAQDNERLAS